MLQQVSVAQKPDKADKSEPQLAKKPFSMKPEQIEVPVAKEASSIFVSKNVYKKPKMVVNTGTGQGLSFLVPENHLEQIGKVEPVEPSLIMQELPGIESDDEELTIAHEQLTEYQVGAELVEAEYLSTDPFHIVSGEFGATQAREAEESELDSLLATLPFLEFDRPINSGEDVDAAETLPRPVLSKQLAEYIQTLESDKSEESAAILDIILEKIQEMVQEPIEAGGAIDDPEAVQQELEALCVRLLACMDVEPTPEHVNYLLQNLMSEVEERVSSAVKSTDEQGTHERKQDLGLMLTDWRAWMDNSLAHVVGQYAIHLTAQYAVVAT